MKRWRAQRLRLRDSVPSSWVNWDAVAKRAINAQFGERCHAQWIRNGGASVDECGPMPRKQGVLDDSAHASALDGAGFYRRDQEMLSKGLLGRNG